MINTWIQDLEQSELIAYGRDLDNGIIDSIDIDYDLQVDAEAYEEFGCDSICI